MASKKALALVTGGAGFLGSHLCERLLSEGYHALRIDNLRTGSLENIAHLKDESDFEYVNHDVTAYINVPEELDDVYHFASSAGWPISTQTIHINLGGTSLRREQEGLFVEATSSEAIP